MTKDSGNILTNKDVARKYGFEPLCSTNTIDKSSQLPAYAQMANILRSSISKGEPPPGGRLPSESALAKNYSVSAMTARQAISVLESEGLVVRIQGSGTFVKKIDVAASSFGLGSFGTVFSDRENIEVRIINASVKKSEGLEREILGLQPKDPVIVVERMIIYKKEPFTLHISFTKFDPKSPSVESMLDTVVLTDLIFKEGYSNFKKGTMRLVPFQIDKREAELLELEENSSVFKLEHLFFDFNNNPAAFGWFLVSHRKMPMLSKVGVWNE